MLKERPPAIAHPYESLQRMAILIQNAYCGCIPHFINGGAPMSVIDFISTTDLA